MLRTHAAQRVGRAGGQSRGSRRPSRETNEHPVASKALPEEKASEVDGLPLASHLHVVTDADLPDANTDP
jgi:hypothetical protein